MELDDLTKLEGKTIKKVLLTKERHWDESELLIITFTDESELTIESASRGDSGLILELK